MPSKAIYKYSAPVETLIVLDLPRGAEVIHVGDQTGRGDTIQFWAVVPMDALDMVERRRFELRGTGSSAPDGDHIGTVVTAGGRLVWHIFDGGVA
jgi:hypothetical protein